MGTAEILYEAITVDTLVNYRLNSQGEHLHLDFKTTTAAFERDDRKNLAIALSGFANADGGLIVWGIECRKIDGVDSVSALRPIKSLSGLITALNEHSPTATNPAVPGAVHRPIEDPATGPDSGFVVTLIPQSDAGPHMAKFGEDRYYKRAGSKFLKMEHYEVADLFGHRRKPSLQVIWRVERGSTSGGGRSGKMDVKIVIGLSNSGRGSATAPLVMLPRSLGNFAVAPYGISLPPEPLMKFYQDTGLTPPRTHFVGGTDFAIHPGVSFDFAVFRRELSNSEWMPDLTIPYMVAADGFRLMEGVLGFTSDELHTGLETGFDFIAFSGGMGRPPRK